ncbi:hypothetical protein AVEN_172056-1 [Araneus ventricosus]|uniref:Uncharacterized protein n=1 Tax=Araneus ventricosus TaxID=182803 RepID=A0A4Y2EX02_ARAVE|nr:hypothetical protein AVEN_83325-1 [Araneus ventricosus]GBM33021.1 hypothetical protein AVEN_94000-1 [Araneus ventricosus]GBM33047.1 hypothetical protein AVEN_149113-1 [Araneus ventricosus]GBM33064.1 hypothetical protein AVEN_172056-1 [Araneus ventricosus]
MMSSFVGKLPIYGMANIWWWTRNFTTYLQTLRAETPATRSSVLMGETGKVIATSSNHGKLAALLGLSHLNEPPPCGWTLRALNDELCN